MIRQPIIPLFDIDGTLLQDDNKPYDAAFKYAFTTVYNMPEASKRDINPSGMIDSQIIIEVLKFHNFPEEKAKNNLGKAMETIAGYYLKNSDTATLRVLPGVIELLTELQRQKYIMGLLTGNIENIAWKKLKKAGLKGFFTFGAFGNMALRRVDLVEVAAQRARKLLQQNITKDNLIIVGDTLRDIACAKEAGIPAIAVASGVFNEEQLKDAGADLVLHSLEDKKAFLSFLNS